MNNDAGDKKTPVLYLILTYLCTVYVPASRFVTRNTAATAHQAAWLVPLCSLVVFIPFMWALYRISKTFEGQSYHDILCRILGRGAGIALSAAYLVWTLILLCLYLIYAGEQLATAAFVGTDIRLFAFILAGIVAAFLRSGLRVLTRMGSLIYIVGLIQFFVIAALLTPDISVLNLTPVSRLDAAPLLTACAYYMAITCYMTFLFIFNDQIRYGRKDARKFVLAAVFLTLGITQGQTLTLGLFGYELASELTFPFLSAVESISVFHKSARLDSIFMSIWIIHEYVVVAVFAYGACRLLKGIFRLKNDIPVLTALMGLAFFLAVYLCNDIFELTTFSKHVVTVVNLALGVAVPFLLFLTGKARKLI